MKAKPRLSVDAFCGFILRRRMPVLAVLAALTAFMLYEARTVKVESRTIDLFPSTHPYVETFSKYADIFGGASRVVVQVEVKEGTIFNRATLEKIQRVTKAIEFLPAVSNYQVMSIAQRKAKNLIHDANGMRSVPVMWPNVPQTPEEIAQVRDDILSNQLLYGTFVSLDEKAALVVAGFFEDRLDPKLLFNKLQELADKETDANTSLEVIGRPVLVGNILNESPRLALIIGITSLCMLMVLVIYYRNIVGIVVPTAAALMAAVMGFGYLGLVGDNFDPLVLVIPFIITARAISHSVQMVSRFLDELATSKDRLEAAFKTNTSLFKPGVLAIVTDVVGILLIYLAPIPVLQKLAAMGAFWFTSIFLGGMVLSPILMSLLPVPRAKKIHIGKQGLVDLALERVALWCTGRGRFWIFGATALTMGIGVIFANDLVVGDVHPGTPMLWPDSDYNVATDRIADRFTNTEELSVVVEGKTRDAIKSPQVLATIEAFQRHMEQLPEVGATLSIIDVVPRVIANMHGGDPKWELVPDSKEQAAFFLEMLYTSGDPGDLTRFITPDSRNANINMFLRDHKGTTLRAVIAHARDFIDKHPLEEAKFRMAGGYGGLLAAINEEVALFDAKITLASFGAVFLCCVLAFRSILAGFFFLIPLIGSNYMTYALMGAQQIGLDVNALPVVALGCGLGVDYGLYVTEAVKEEFERGASVRDAVVWGLRSAGKGVIITAITMTVGLAFWRFSFLRFQAEMGMLLLFWMTVSMLGGLFLLPGLLVQFAPKFVFGERGRELSTQQAASTP
jgi:predicted RND superfamily exporter protein